MGGGSLVSISYLRFGLTRLERDGAIRLASSLMEVKYVFDRMIFLSGVCLPYRVNEKCCFVSVLGTID